MTGQSSLDGVIINRVSYNAQIRAELVVTDAFANQTTISVANTQLSPGASAVFSVPAASLPLADERMVNMARIRVTQIVDAGPPENAIVRHISDTRYYRHDGTGTISHFDEEVFHDIYHGGLYQFPGNGVSMPVPDDPGILLISIGGNIEDVEVNNGDTDSAEPPPVEIE